MSADVVYIYTNGLVDGRDSYIGRLREGGVPYTEVALTDRKTHVWSNDVALATARMMLGVRLADGKSMRMESLTSAIWSRGPGGWLLKFYQGTPAPAAS